MQPKSETANQLRSDPHSFQPGGVYSEPWWRGNGYNPMAQTMSGENASNSSSLDGPNGDSESNEEGQSLSNSGLNEEDDDAAKDSQPAAPNQSGNCGQEQQGMQNTATSAPSMREECLTQAPQLELVGHSIGLGAVAGSSNKWIEEIIHLVELLLGLMLETNMIFNLKGECSTILKTCYGGGN